MENLKLQEMEQIEGGNWLGRLICGVICGGPHVYVDDLGTGYSEVWFP